MQVKRLHGSIYVYEPSCHDKCLRTMTIIANLILDNSLSQTIHIEYLLQYFIHDPMMVVLFAEINHVLIFGYGHVNLQCFVFSTIHVVAP